MKAINQEAVQAQVAVYLEAQRGNESTQQMINRLVGYSNPDKLIGFWGDEIARQAEDKTEKNKGLSIFRGQLKRAAKALELDIFPTVKLEKGADHYHVEWSDLVAAASSELQVAFNEFKKDPNADTRAALIAAMDNHEAEATAETKEEDTIESADMLTLSLAVNA